jgi:flagellar basal-body rod protein FlgC
MANASTAAQEPGKDPYSRQTVTFKNEMDRKKGFNIVKVDKVESDKKTPFLEKYMPDHPGANEQGYVKMPNVNPLIEAMDMREAQRTYEANLGMMEQSRNMALQTIDLLRR